MHLVELSRQQHAHLRIDPARMGELAASCHMIPLVVSEFRRAIADFPIILAKHQETGRFSPYALMGLAPGENLFWDGTGLESSYVPLNLRRLPFFIGIDEERNAVCVDMESPMIGESGPEGLVETDGRDTAYFGEIQKILHELLTWKPRTDQFIQTLAERDLIAELRLNIVLKTGTSLALAGVYGLDEERFRRLPDEVIAQFRRDGTLDLAYAVMLSTARIQSLIDRRNRAEAKDRAWFQ